jgi:hypothetical protein
LYFADNLWLEKGQYEEWEFVRKFPPTEKLKTIRQSNNDMRKTLFIITNLLLLFTSWKIERPLNSDTWYVKLGHRELLTWQKNEVGDTATIDLIKLKTNDTLYVQQYFCGGSAENSVTILQLLNQDNQVIAETTNNRDSFLFFTGSMALKDVLINDKIKKGEILSILFTIYQKKGNLNEKILLGRLKLN